MVRLGAPASQQFNLQGEGEASAITIMWQPEGREAFEVEVRARIVGNSASEEAFPLVRYKTETGAATAVWKEPFDPHSIQQHYGGFLVPARGMAWRTGARQFRISFFNDGTITGGPLDQATLQVTILPVWSGHVDTIYGDGTQFGILEPGAKVINFPMTAREWKLVDVAGVPFAPAANFVAFVALNGAPFGFPNDASLYADWQPIPFNAVGWGVAVGETFAAYR
jgi:hypothetical protein